MKNKILLIGYFVIILVAYTIAQGPGYKTGNAISVTTSVPATCSTGEMAIVTTTVSQEAMGLYFCAQNDVWQRLSSSLLKNFSNVQNNTFIDTISISVPNIALSALVQVDVLGALGAGGALGAFESSSGRTVYIAITRILNVGTAATLTVVANAADAQEPGGAGITISTQLGAITGAVTATQTIQLQVRVTRGGGTSNNHAISIRALVLKAFGPGVTLL